MSRKLYDENGNVVKKRHIGRNIFAGFVGVVVLIIVIIVVASNRGGGSGSPAASSGGSSATQAAKGSAAAPAPLKSTSAPNTNPACGSDLNTMEHFIAKGDYSDAGSDANDDSTDATRDNQFSGLSISQDYSQLGMDADSADMDKMTGGSTYNHDVTEVSKDLATLKNDCN